MTYDRMQENSMANQQIEKFQKFAKKGSEPKLSRADESEILKWLHATAKRNLFSEASWPVDDERSKRTGLSLRNVFQSA